MYTDDGVFALERARVFGGPAWVGVGGLHQLPEAGTHFTADVAGEPILVLRGADGALGAFFNVCPHRGGPLARGSGKLRGVLQCLYHGWTFGLDGALVRARDFGGEVDAATCRLRPVRVEAWLESVFVALDPAAPPLVAYIGDLGHRIERYRLGGFAYAFSKDFELPVNWKVAWETAAESYHLPIVHPQLRFDPRRFREEVAERHSVQVSLPVGAGDAAENGEGPPLESLVVNLFPNTFLIVPSPVRWDRPYLKSTYLLPRDVATTLYRSDFYVPRERVGDEAWLAPLHAAWDDLNRQDRQICEELQRGVGSMAYQPGPLSPRWERSLHHFHGLLVRHLRGEAVTAKEAG